MALKITALIVILFSLETEGTKDGPCFNDCNAHKGNRWVCKRDSGCEGCHSKDEICNKLCDRCLDVKNPSYGGLDCQCPQCWDSCADPEEGKWICNKEFGCEACTNKPDICEMFCERCKQTENPTYAGLECDCPEGKCWESCNNPDEDQWICKKTDGCEACSNHESTCENLCKVCPGTPSPAGLNCDCPALDLDEPPLLPSVVSIVNPMNWVSECFRVFSEADCCAFDDDNFVLISNFDLIDKPSGICADILACAFERCDASDGFDGLVGEDLTSMSDVDIMEAVGPLDLPDLISFPKSVADIVTAVNYARENNLKVSIKSTGHNQVGAHTIKGSLQLNLRDLPKYSFTSAVECIDVSAGSPDFDACELAMARGHGAIVRVGGGEVWSDVYLNVMNSFGAEYGVMGATSGTVGAAGGWLQGGGLSYGPERQYGVGVDQVLELEMVLADGRHVRFAPSQWEDSDGFFVPRTLAVDGFCNSIVVSDESQWNWQVCESPKPPFEDLWFAVRGGGGGTYGVVTSVKYQLHDPAGFHRVSVNPAAAADLFDATEGNDGLFEKASRLFVFFLIDLFYNPSNIDISEETSSLCGGPGLSLNLTSRQTNFNCYKAVWESEVLGVWDAAVDGAVTTDPELSDIAPFLRDIFRTTFYENWADRSLSLGWVTWSPEGTVKDIPPPGFYPDDGGWCSAQIPIQLLQSTDPDDRELVYELFTTMRGRHPLGGRVAFAHDQMNAVPKTQRMSAVSSPSLFDLSEDLQERLLSATLKFTMSDGETFPGISEYNHICKDMATVFKDDPTTFCPADMPVAQKEAQCYSPQETVWGVDLYAELQSIKATVDPNNLFDCYSCVKPPS